jgi:hypothetical protein
MPITHWLLYADHRVASICRSLTPVEEPPPEKEPPEREPPDNEPPEPPIEEPPIEDALERLLVLYFLRRYATWCARQRRFAAMDGAARLYRLLTPPD